MINVILNINQTKWDCYICLNYNTIVSYEISQHNTFFNTYSRILWRLPHQAWQTTSFPSSSGYWSPPPTLEFSSAGQVLFVLPLNILVYHTNQKTHTLFCHSAFTRKKKLTTIFVSAELYMFKGKKFTQTRCQQSTPKCAWAANKSSIYQKNK